MRRWNMHLDTLAAKVSIITMRMAGASGHTTANLV